MLCFGITILMVIYEFNTVNLLSHESVGKPLNDSNFRDGDIVH